MHLCCEKFYIYTMWKDTIYLFFWKVQFILLNLFNLTQVCHSQMKRALLCVGLGIADRLSLLFVCFTLT